jgi:hypothetical protein
MEGVAKPCVSLFHHCFIYVDRFYLVSMAEIEETIRQMVTVETSTPWLQCPNAHARGQHGFIGVIWPSQIPLS